MTGAPGTAQTAGSSSLHSRRAALLVRGVVVLLVVDLWVIAAMPWWPLATLIGGAVALRTLGRFVSRRARYLVAIAGLLAILFVAPQLVWAVLFLTAGGFLAPVPLGPYRPTAHANRHRLWPAAALVVAGVAGLAVQQARADQQTAAEQEQASALSRASMLPTSPDRVVREVLAAVVDDDPVVCALAFSPEAARQLATATTSVNCRAAVHVLARRVVDPRRYQRPDRDSVTITLAPDGQTATVDACHLTWHGSTGLLRDGASDHLPTPGPQLGRLDLTRILGRGFQITHYSPC